MTKRIPNLSYSAIETFWGRAQVVGLDECWIWTGYRNASGYGLFGVGAKLFLAHRVSYFLTFGEAGDLIVRHRCDNPPCVNPLHLLPGTAADNAMDARLRGRAKNWGKTRQSLVNNPAVRKLIELAQSKVPESSQDIRKAKLPLGEEDNEQIFRLLTQYNRDRVSVQIKSVVSRKEADIMWPAQTQAELFQGYGVTDETFRDRMNGKPGNPCVGIYGPGPDGVKCKDCFMISRKQCGHRAYFKCMLRGDTNGPGTDHRANWPACGRFVQKGQHL